MNKICVFCNENRFCLNKKIGLDSEQAVIYEDEYIYVTPDLAPLSEGHLLIVSQEHYNSFANAPRDVRNSLMKMLEYLSEDIYRDSDITWFEHGAVFEGTGGASIDHAHLHVIPKSLKLIEAVEHDKKYIEKKSYTEKNFVELLLKQPYLWIGSRKTSYLYYVNELPSQYLRKKVMELLHGEDFDWKENFYLESSIKKYKDTLNLIVEKRGTLNG